MRCNTHFRSSMNSKGVSQNYVLGFFLTTEILNLKEALISFGVLHGSMIYSLFWLQA